MPMEYREFGKFTLLDHMGRGGVGNVYRANDNQAGNIVAIKIFEPSDGRTAETACKLRDREVSMLINVQHPNIVRYYESGSVGDAYYYTMEFVENSLLKRMRGGSELPLADKVHILRQTCNALQAIHHQGIVHRDVKPGNILLDEAPSGAIHVKVTDLGIAKHVTETDVVREDQSRRVPGTPKYLSPEQIRLKPVDGRADVFSLGVVAYELLSGQPPFKGETGEEFLKANLRQEARPIHHVNAKVPAFLSPVLDKMLSKDREERYDSDTLARDLELTHQCLVSGAPLVEASNPDSIFYIPPVPETPAEPPQRPAVQRWQGAIAGALVLVGAAVGYILRPEFPRAVPAGKPIDLTAPPDLSAGQTLEKAGELLDGQQRWRALALVRMLDPPQLDAAQLSQWNTLCRELQNALAAESYQQGRLKLQQDRTREAEIVLGTMKAFFPDADLTRSLEDEFQQRQKTIEQQQEWDRRVAELEKALAERAFRRALADAVDLLGRASSDEKRALVQRGIVRVLNGWQAALLRGNPDPPQIKECVEALGRYAAEDWASADLQDRRGELHLRLSRHYGDLGAVEQQLETLTFIIERYAGTPFAEAAREDVKRIVQDMRLDPVDIQLLSRELAKNGFKGGVWFSDLPEGGEQDVSDAGLVITQKGGGTERTNSRQIVRPMRSVPGFQFSAKFRLSAPDAVALKSSAAGIRLQDRQGNAIALHFDGAGYSVSRSYVRQGRVLTGSSSVRAAFGDEAETWHVMTMRYQFDLSRLDVLLDGEPVAEQKVELGVCRFGVFARVTGEGACRAEFKEVACGPP